MIKLERTPKPVELTPELQEKLTETFKSRGKPVWNKEFIKKGLLRFSHNKCCYCECNITEESKYLEVEHYYPKGKYKDKVVEWDNLLPSCKRCNGTKGEHDTAVEPIINPSKTNPKEHLKFWRYRIKGVDEIGELTVSVLDLNEQDRLVLPRFQIGNAVIERLESLNEMTDEYIKGIQASTRRKNRIQREVKGLMREGLPSSVYSACVSTIILTEQEYSELKEKLISFNLWDDELQGLENELYKIALISA